MALIRNAANKVRRGVVGQDTFYYTGGRQIVRQAKNNSNYGESASRSVAQQTRRVMWGNLVNTYQVIASFLPLAFGKQPSGQSSFTRYMQINANVNPFPLTKDHAARGMIVPRGYIVSDGPLPSIQVDPMDSEEEYFDTFINCLNIGQTTTVGQFSQSIVNENDFKDGDNIGVIRVFSDTTSGLPAFAEADYHEITLDVKSTTLASAYVASDIFNTVDGTITLKSAENFVMCAVIHSRLVGSKLLCSRQQLVVTTPVAEQRDALLASGYTRRAMESYGVDAEALITPLGRDLLY